MYKIYFIFSFIYCCSLSANSSKGHVLVTGGAGYIGSHACKELSKAGYIPVVVDSLVTGTPQAIKWGPFIQGDFSNEEVIGKIFAAYKFVAVLHFAAFISVEESVIDPLKYYRNNVAGTLTLIEAMKKAHVNKIIFSSSASVYGNSDKMPLVESSPLSPLNPYGRTKSMIEEILSDCYKAYGIHFIALRYFNVAGADVEGEIGCNQKKPTNLIPIVLQVASKKRDRLSIFGTDYSTPDGTAVRDYIHVTDLARAHVLALEYLLRGKPSTTINLGTGHGYSVKEIIDSAERCTGCSIPRREDPRREGDAPISIASYARAQKLLGWTPHHSDLNTIISTAWRWHQRLLKQEQLETLPSKK